MDVSSIALQGLQLANAQLEAAATSVAGAASPDAGPVDVVDLSAEVVALTSANTLFEANIFTLKTADQLQQNLINIIA